MRVQLHLVDTSIGHLGSTSIVGGGIPLGTGLGLAIQMKKQDRVSVIFFGDGAADEGVFYESVNFAVLKKLPVIFILENNQYSVCSHISARQAGDNVFHNMNQTSLFSCKIDGNDIIKVYHTARQAVERARSGQGPSFIECKTYRIRGHAGCESQDFKGYRTDEEVAIWKERCPIDFYQNKLLEQGVMTQENISLMEKEIDFEIEQAFISALQDPLPKSEDLSLYLFLENERMPWSKIKAEFNEPDSFREHRDHNRVLAYSEAIKEALAEALRHDPNVFIMGQGVDDPGGMFGTTLGLHKEFGQDRVFDTPLSETALTGVAAGAAMGGMRPGLFSQ